MMRSVFHVAWRAMLALSLAAGPWPPAAWAFLAPATETAGMGDCHDRDADAAPPSDTGRACQDDCCPDPACDPSHCLVIHATIVSPPLAPRLAIAPAAVPEWRGRACADPPALPLLRPPIA